MKRKAKDLKKGDVISSGTISYVGTPQSYVGSKNQVRVDIIYNGKTDYVTRYWNANTELVVLQTA